MGFMHWIRVLLVDVFTFFYSIYDETAGWVWPFNLISTPFYNLYATFVNITKYWIDFSDWTLDVWDKMLEVVSLLDITLYFEWFWDAAANAWDWVVNAFWNVWSIIESWWSGAQFTVLTWIAEAKLWFQALLDQANAWLAMLQSYWDSIAAKIPAWDAVVSWWTNWPGNVLAAITGWWAGTLGDVVGLIAGAFVEREDFWAGWQDFRDRVSEFFTDPLEFLLDLFTDWFLGPEE